MNTKIKTLLRDPKKVVQFIEMMREFSPAECAVIREQITRDRRVWANEMSQRPKGDRVSFKMWISYFK